jgi:hypothetical protein
MAPGTGPLNLLIMVCMMILQLVNGVDFFRSNQCVRKQIDMPNEPEKVRKELSGQ